MNATRAMCPPSLRIPHASTAASYVVPDIGRRGSLQEQIHETPLSATEAGDGSCHLHGTDHTAGGVAAIPALGPGRLRHLPIRPRDRPLPELGRALPAQPARAPGPRASGPITCPMPSCGEWPTGS